MTDLYNAMIWAWGSNTAWACLPEDMGLGRADVIMVGVVPAVATGQYDRDRAFLYSWCMRSELVS